MVVPNAPVAGTITKQGLGAANMPVHLRFKRRLRLLHEAEVIRVVTDLSGDISLPAGAVFDHLLAAFTDDPPEDAIRDDLSERMNADGHVVQALLDRLFELKLVERYDPMAEPASRFDRQLLLFDALAPVDDHAQNIERQRRLADAHVLILGLGGIGHQVALSLAAAGVGYLTLVDADVVEESNLHRQVLFATDAVGRPKVEAAREGLLRIAPSCMIDTERTMVQGADDWRTLIGSHPLVRHVMLSADRPVQLVNWLSDARRTHDYHFIKCGYMSTQGLIGPLLGPDTCGYEALFASWGDLIDAQPGPISAFNAKATAPSMAASNAIMANIATMELIKHITGIGPLTTWEQRLLLDLRDYTVHPG